MYRTPDPQMTIDDFILPFSGGLSVHNRWVQLARLIPWEEIEKEYAFMFPSNRGNVAKPVRMALGSLIIQAKGGFTDRETVQQITENPYLQYFIGLKEFQLEKPFTPVALVKFRKRFNAKRMAKINELIIQAETQLEELKRDEENENDPPQGPTGSIEESKTAETSPPPQGTLTLDATCVPADIHYPSDLRLLHTAREKLDAMIDTLHAAQGKKGRRPRTYRIKARQAFLSVTKQKKPRKAQMRKAIKKQLQYCKRNLNIVQRLLEESTPSCLNHQQRKQLSTIEILLEQQKSMFKRKSHQIADRIVSLNQPHLRPIVRGKINAAVEFGAKVAISLEQGYSRIEKLSFDAFNESQTLQSSAENYFFRNGYYPEVILADQIYRNRENRAYCEERGIRLSGPKLGKPSAQASLQKIEKSLAKQDARKRNAVEGKFGEAKRKYGLNRIRTKLQGTSECRIALALLVMNLEHKLRVLFVQFLYDLLGLKSKTVLA